MSENSQEDLNSLSKWDSLELSPDKILVEEDDGNYKFTTETQLEARKIAYEIGKSVFKQRLGDRYKEGSEDSLLRNLKVIEGKIDDYRLDGNQLSFSEENDPTSQTWETSIFFRYSSPEDLERLQRAVESLGIFEKGNQ